MDSPPAQPADPSSLTHVLVASMGEPFDGAVIERAVTLAGDRRPTMHVLSIARIYGTALGLQHPSLYPSKREWQAQVDLVGEAVQALKGRGFEADGRVVGSRHPSKTIANAAAAVGCQAIVIGAQPVTIWHKILFQDEVAKLTRRAGVPVHAVAREARGARLPSHM